MIRTYKTLIKDLYSECKEKPLEVYEIFKTFYGNDKVDMQGLSETEIERKCNDFFINGTSVSYYTSPGCKSLCDEEFGTLTDERYYTILRNTLNIIADSLGINIIVYFPTVKVTNEFDKSIIISKVFIKLKIDILGKMAGSFKMNRAEYTKEQFLTNYMHSHAQGIPKNNFTEFQYCCLGRGPINNTISFLNSEFDKDKWELFCFELKKYLETESIEGVPFYKLESVSNISNAISIDKVCINKHFAQEDFIKDFFKWFLRTKNILKFSYVNGMYSLGMSYLEYYIKLSNAFIEYYNMQGDSNKKTVEELKLRGDIIEGIVKNNKVYSINPMTSNFDNFIGRKVLDFKGEDILLNIKSSEDKGNKSILLAPSYASVLLYSILLEINNKYGNKTARNTISRVSYSL